MSQTQDKRNTKKQEGPKMVPLFLRVPASLNKRLRLHLFQNDLHLKDFGTDALKEKLDRAKGAAA